VVDTFYVRDANGERISDDQHRQRIIETLLLAVG